MSTLIYGKVTNIYNPFNTKDRAYIINNDLAVSTPSGSLFARTISRGDYGYFVFNDDMQLVDFYKPVMTENVIEGKLQHHEMALKAATKRMVHAYNQLGANDKAICIGAVSTLVSGSLCAASLIGTAVSIVSGDFTGILGGAAASAVTGAYAYFAYDSMTTAMQNAYDCSVAFNNALALHRQTTLQYAPEHMQSFAIYNTQFSVFTKFVRKVLPHITEEQFMNNEINWSVA